MQRGRKKILYAVVAVVTICVVFAAGYFSQPRRREPVYQGKTLTNWLRQLDDREVFGISSYKLPSPTRRQLEAAQAIRAMGAAALPLLMEDIRARPADNAFRIRLHRWLNAHLASALSGQFWFLDVTEEDRRR